MRNRQTRRGYVQLERPPESHLRRDNIEGLHNTWVMALSGLSKAPDLDVLEYCYFQQVKGFRPLSEDIAHYNREEEGSKDRSYEYLFDSVN